MREALISIGERLRELPGKIADLVVKKAEAAEQIRLKTERMKEIEIATANEVAAEKKADGKPAFPNETTRQAEAAKRLKSNPEYVTLEADMSVLKKFLLSVEKELEYSTRTFKADTTILSAVAALFTTGRTEDAEALLKAYTNKPDTVAPEQETPQDSPQEPKKTNGLETGTFTVLEAKMTDRGAVRAWCQKDDTGEKIAIYAKGDSGKTLASAVGAKVEAKYRKVDKGLFAVSVKEVA